MPPLVATMAAAVVIAVARRRREQEPDVGLQSREPLGDGLRRTALGQLDLAVRLLDSPGEVDARAVHEIRKALKRLRAFLRLVHGEIGQAAYDRESAALRRVGRSLAGAREAEVMLATLDRLIERHPGKLAGRGPVIRLRAQLRSEREVEIEPATLARDLIELRACRTRVAAWELSGDSGLALVEPGLVRIYRQGRRRYQRVRRGKRDQVLAMHEWRKRVKDLRYVAEMLERQAPPPPRLSHKRDRRARRGQQRLHRLARRSDELGELLGEDHDLAVLEARVRRRGEPSALPRRTRKRISKLISRRRRELRRAALSRGDRLFSRSPAGFLRRVRESYVS